MTTSFAAIFEKGVLRPLEPVDLPENGVVRLTLHLEPATTPESDRMSESQHVAFLAAVRRIAEQSNDEPDPYPHLSHDQVIYDPPGAP